jgi:hypothetical protein
MNMPTKKSDLTRTLDELQNNLRPRLTEWGFRSRGRTFNRENSDGLTEVIHLQAGSFDPPGTTYFPGLRENLYGKLTINIGTFVPEVARVLQGDRSVAFIQVPRCQVRSRLGIIGPEARDIWWEIRADRATIQDLLHRLTNDAIPFFGRFNTREKILTEWRDVSRSPFAIGGPPRIVCAIILTEKGRREEARTLLAAQVSEAETANPPHAAYVRALIDRLGLGRLP